MSTKTINEISTKLSDFFKTMDSISGSVTEQHYNTKVELFLASLNESYDPKLIGVSIIKTLSSAWIKENANLLGDYDLKACQVFLSESDKFTKELSEAISNMKTISVCPSCNGTKRLAESDGDIACLDCGFVGKGDKTKVANLPFASTSGQMNEDKSKSFIHGKVIEVKEFGVNSLYMLARVKDSVSSNTEDFGFVIPESKANEMGIGIDSEVTLNQFADEYNKFVGLYTPSSIAQKDSIQEGFKKVIFNSLDEAKSFASDMSGILKVDISAKSHIVSLPENLLLPFNEDYKPSVASKTISLIEKNGGKLALYYSDLKDISTKDVALYEGIQLTHIMNHAVGSGVSLASSEIVNAVSNRLKEIKN